MNLNEVSPPGFGHTKSDKKKGVKKGGTAAAFDRARKEGRFKGSKSDMFAIMWSQKKKGDKPHYKPGTDKKYKKYEKVDEAKTIRSKEDAEKARQQRDNPDEWVVRNKGGGHHGLNRKSALKGQAKRRAGNLPSLKQKELEDHGKRNLHPDYKKTARKAIKIERDRKKEQRLDAQSKSKETGKQHDVDHVQGQSNRKKHSDRWHKIHPGDASDNRRVISQADNLKKNSKDTGGKKITRSSAIKRALDRAREVRSEGIAKFDKLTKAIKGSDVTKDKEVKLLKIAGKVRGIPEEVSRRRKPSAIRKRKKLDSVMNKYDDLKKKIGSKEKHMEPALKEMTYQEAIDAGWEMTGEGIWWPPQPEPETIKEKISFPTFKKKVEERKPKKAMDAGAKARRKLKRKEHAKYVSGSEDNVPDDIRDHKEY